MLHIRQKQWSSLKILINASHDTNNAISFPEQSSHLFQNSLLYMYDSFKSDVQTDMGLTKIVLKCIGVDIIKNEAM